MTEYSGIALGLGRIASGLFVVTTGRDAQATGMLTSFVQQAGFEPPAVTIAVQKERAILATLRDCGAFCVSVLHDASKPLLAHFARGFEPGVPAFDGIDTAVAPNGVPYPTAAHAHVACEIVGEADWSDHIIVCGKVLDGGRSDEEQPLVHVRKNGLSY